MLKTCLNRQSRFLSSTSYSTPSSYLPTVTIARCFFSLPPENGKQERGILSHSYFNPFDGSLITNTENFPQKLMDRYLLSPKERLFMKLQDTLKPQIQKLSDSKATDEDLLRAQLTIFEIKENLLGEYSKSFDLLSGEELIALRNEYNTQLKLLVVKRESAICAKSNNAFLDCIRNYFEITLDLICAEHCLQKKSRYLKTLKAHVKA